MCILLKRNKNRGKSKPLDLDKEWKPVPPVIRVYMKFPNGINRRFKKKKGISIKTERRRDILYSLINVKKRRR